ncbi:polar amino acid transport system substrate-binding protein [Verrucomicrobium sp. GAS474]|uniref:substrate-binding periplasmic protein n=1 Tax=Verrucomicrobium sp. GAS474 TaxID=1882831 RepID=UPI00087CE935|nr:transporter substrate-binding domain-containing protein [Verrucomicrobium sp. GAS474]SDU02507.1 polar amino acid transport system substrate-binding protein [Verrucomicrobium sp. GAS474]
MKSLPLLALLLLPFLAFAAPESTYDKVMRSGTIRVGYLASPPGVIKDPNTGKLTGIAVEALDKAAANLQLKTAYVEEGQWSTMIEGLATGRYDVVMMAWASGARARLADFSMPLFYSAVNAYARPDDKRFTPGASLDQILSANPDLKIATVDGDVTEVIAKSKFPNAKTYSLPQNADIASLLLSVSTKKADLVFEEAASAKYFLDHNPGTLREVSNGTPVGVCPNIMLIPRGQPEFKAMLNNALAELVDLGYVDTLIKQYEPFPGALLPLSTPYRVPGKLPK